MASVYSLTEKKNLASEKENIDSGLRKSKKKTTKITMD